MQNVLVIGGAGFIGSHLIDVLVQEPINVYVYDNFSTGRKEFLTEKFNLFEQVGNILDVKSLDAIFRNVKPEHVYHLAALHHIPTCELNPEFALEVNIIGTQNVLRCCVDHKVQKVILASTGGIYDIKEEALTETDALQPKDIYTISKLACENLLQYYANKHELSCVAGRIFNTVGTRETNAHIIPDIVTQLSRGNHKIKLGNLTPRRDYIHVEDTAAGLFELSKIILDGNFETFNIGSGVDYSVKEIIDLFEGIINQPIEAISVPELQRKIDRPTQLSDLIN